MDTPSIDPSTRDIPTENQDFAKVVEESKLKIHEAALVETKKRGRGRPPKAPPQGAQASPLQTSQNSVPTAMGAYAPQPPPDLGPYLIDPLIAVSKIPASNHGIPELALTREEAQACATALNECLKAFVPDMGTMSPKTAAVIGAFVTFGSIGFTKYQIYLEHKPKAPKIEPEVQEKIAEDQKNSGISAMDAFRG